MLPVSNTNYVPLQSPLINTTLPGSTVTHVPYDNVAPSVSNAQVDNNATSNSDFGSGATEEETSLAQDASGAQPSPAITGAAAPPSQNVGVQATYLAQLLAQDGSPETGSILVQYEKLIALSNVKYKPSNAQKPVDEPSASFGRILQQEHPVVQEAQPPQQAPQLAQAITEPAAPSNPPENSVDARGAAAAAPPPAPAAQVSSAYAQSATRYDVQAAANATAVA